MSTPTEPTPGTNDPSTNATVGVTAAPESQEGAAPTPPPGNNSTPPGTTPTAGPGTPTQTVGEPWNP